MIIDLFLLVLHGVLNILLSPLNLLNITFDFISTIPSIVQFVSVIAYILPWGNLLPLIAIIVGLFIFRSSISLIKTILDVIPFV